MVVSSEKGVYVSAEDSLLCDSDIRVESHLSPVPSLGPASRNQDLCGREDSGANCPAPWSATDEGCSEYMTVAGTGEQELPSP